MCVHVCARWREETGHAGSQAPLTMNPNKKVLISIRIVESFVCLSSGAAHTEMLNFHPSGNVFTASIHSQRNLKLFDMPEGFFAHNLWYTFGKDITITITSLTRNVRTWFSLWSISYWEKHWRLDLEKEEFSNEVKGAKIRSLKRMLCERLFTFFRPPAPKWLQTNLLMTPLFL